MKTHFFLFIVLFALVVNACSADSSLLRSDRIITSTIVSPSSIHDGKATLKGQIISNKTKKPIAHQPVRLAEVFYSDGNPRFLLDAAFSPGAISDENGFFAITNIQPKEYVITIGEFFSDWKTYAKDDQAIVVKLEVDKIVNLGAIEINWENVQP